VKHEFRGRSASQSRTVYAADDSDQDGLGSGSDDLEVDNPS